MIVRPDYTVIRLSDQDSDRLQALFERCTDFFELTAGQPPEPTAARSEFTDVPVGKTPEDLHFFGLCDSQNCLVGTIIAVQQYPDNQTWWIGMMLLAPSHRGQGIGKAFYQGFEGWLGQQGIQAVELLAIAANAQGRAFWQSLGFVEIRQTPPRLFGQKTHTVHVYRRRIPGSSP
ncbi:GNAT family N-acetyltransferase [Coleofasciculus sp. E2-BRE-01]|uniref:GNAT family N-acetyltransferase n=1 Tax=Coleofasciculus sp. E2-BRE-01 TaxID=3069524 RepID=UPI0032FAA08D